MRTIKFVNPDFTGVVNEQRHASRGIIVEDNKILLSYESKNDLYMIPGGGLEKNESLSENCKREILEETGNVVLVKENYLNIEEYYLSFNHINHYFICNITKQGVTNLTDAEIENGLTPKWILLDEAISIFSKYKEYINKDIPRYGLYRRELEAILEYKRFIHVMDTKKYLESFKPTCIQEEADKKYMLEMYNILGDKLFSRESLSTHFSASCWITNKDHTKILMNYHNIYKNWGWLGGHSDNEKDFLYVALKEAHEESGLKNIKVLLKEPISLEILPVTYHIKNGKFVSSHTHMNLTYLFEADEKEELTIKPDENSGLKWVLIDDVLNMTNEEAMKPIYQKLNKVLKEV